MQANYSKINNLLKEQFEGIFQFSDTHDGHF